MAWLRRWTAMTIPRLAPALLLTLGAAGCAGVDESCASRACAPGLACQCRGVGANPCGGPGSPAPEGSPACAQASCGGKVCVDPANPPPPPP